MTAQKIQEVYYSRQWTAFHEHEASFAQAFAEYHGAKYGVFTINGTVTLQCAMGAYGIGPGDEVIVPPLTWYATAVRHVSALEAEGLPVCQTEGPIYRFMLFNVEPENYRIDQPCSMTEHARARVLWFLHPYLGLEQPQIEKIAEALEKVIGNADALRMYMKKPESLEAPFW